MRSATTSFDAAGLRQLLSLLAVLLVCLFSLPLAAQSESIVTPDKLQYDLYEQGTEAYGKKEYEKAIELFEASLVIGPLNITYLTLGRAFFKVGQCDKASGAYAKARSAPKIASPTPMEVLRKIEQYVAELPGACPAYIKLACSPPSLEIYVDGQGPSSCDETITLLPGEHTIRAELEGQVEEQKVNVAGMDKLRINFKFEAPIAEADADKPVEDISERRLLSDFMLDVGFGFILGGTADIASNSGQIIQPTHDESSSATIDFSGAYRVFDGLYLGLRVGVVTDYELSDPTQTPLRTFPIKGTQTEINLLSRYIYPVGNFLLMANLDGGLSMLAPEGNFESMAGSNLGVGPGIGWRFSGDEKGCEGQCMAVILDSRFAFYNLASTAVTEDLRPGDGIQDAEFSNGSRFSLNLRFSLGF
jgi:hypothetical protein